jgi:hypothetical protein
MLRKFLKLSKGSEVLEEESLKSTFILKSFWNAK